MAMSPPVANKPDPFKPDVYWSCHRKKRYYEFGRAFDDAVDLQRKGKFVSPYNCKDAEPGDEHYHVGHPPGSYKHSRLIPDKAYR